jgi:hypothetical protein
LVYSTVPVLAGERELKYGLPAARAEIARRLLDRYCRRDPVFPEAVVWTIYYDTPGLQSLGEKINSDYLKQKVRVRWYSGLDGRPSGPSFVEAKLRVGNRRLKVRAPLPYSAGEIASWDLQDPRLLQLPLALKEQGIELRHFWRPILLLRYRRDRFIDPISGSRASLDADIAATAVHPGSVSAADYSPLGSAVVEVKGSADELPLALRGLLHLGAQKCSFSKYLAVYSHMTRHRS